MPLFHFQFWRLFLLDTEFQDNRFFFPFSNLKMPFHQFFFFSASIVFDETSIILILVPLCISIVYTFSLDPLKYFLLNFRFLKFDRKVPGCGFLCDYTFGDLLNFLDVEASVFHKIWEVFSSYPDKYFVWPISLSFPSGITVIFM